MPFYEVHHSYPLEPKQKSHLAQSITKLHATAFTTPSIFVHVRFAACDASERNYYLAGEPRLNSTNRVIGMVRTSSKRSKADFDKLAARIEDAWYDAVIGERIDEGKDKGKRKGEEDETEKDKEAKKLGLVVFYPMLAARELGLEIPEAGQEGPWFKENMKLFKEKADMGDGDFEGMVKEFEERDDLKKLVS